MRWQPRLTHDPKDDDDDRKMYRFTLDDGAVFKHTGFVVTLLPLPSPQINFASCVGKVAIVFGVGAPNERLNGTEVQLLGWDQEKAKFKCRTKFEFDTPQGDAVPWLVLLKPSRLAIPMLEVSKTR